MRHVTSGNKPATKENSNGESDSESNNGESYNEA